MLPAPSPLYWAEPGSESLGRGCLFHFSSKKKKKKKQMKMSRQLKIEHKNIKNSDDSGQAVLGRGKGGEGDRARGIPLPAVHQRPTLPSKKGRPHRAQRPGQRGKAQEHGGWGHKHPLRSPGAGQKGDYKSQETTKLNTKVGTAGKGKGMGRKERCSPSRLSLGARGHAGLSDLVVDVRWALGRHLLDDVDRVPVVPTHLLIVGTVVVLCSP